MKYLLSILVFLYSCGDTYSPTDSNILDTEYTPSDGSVIFFESHKSFCGDGFCNSEETMISCWRDCRPKLYKDKNPEEIPIPPPWNPIPKNGGF